MKLLSLQRRMARAVMTPLTPSERMRSVGPDGRSMRAVAWKFIIDNIGFEYFQASPKIFPAFAACSVEAASIAWQKRIFRIVLRNRSLCVIWARAWKPGCEKILSGLERARI